MNPLIRTGDLARELGLPRSTAVYYISYGLFRPVTRTPGGSFLFSLDENRKRLEKIKELKKKRIRVIDIREQLNKI